jgi:hypothetical protein
LSVLDTRWAHLLASPAAETAINMTLKGRRVAFEPAFTDSPHQIKTAARSVVFIAGNDVGGTSLETQPAVYAGEKLLFFMRESRTELG